MNTYEGEWKVVPSDRAWNVARKIRKDGGGIRHEFIRLADGRIKSYRKLENAKLAAEAANSEES